MAEYSIHYTHNTSRWAFSSLWFGDYSKVTHNAHDSLHDLVHNSQRQYSTPDIFHRVLHPNDLSDKTRHDTNDLLDKTRHDTSWFAHQYSQSSPARRLILIRQIFGRDIRYFNHSLDANHATLLTGWTAELWLILWLWFSLFVHIIFF